MSAEDAPVLGVHEGTLDRATLDRLFADLGAAARVHSVLLKGAAEGYAVPGLDLAAARDALVQRRVAAVQIRYAWDGAEWCDTLMAAGEGARVVRVRVDDCAR